MGTLDLIALIPVIAPRSWIAASHAALGLGPFPTDAIAGYLARSISSWYAFYGLLLWFVSYDLDRYSRLITCLGYLMILQGILILGIDLTEGMPSWWTALEGPCSSGLGLGLLLLQRSAEIRKDGRS